MKNFFKYFIFIYLLCFSIFDKAYAYLDPGTGSILLQAIIGFISAIAAGFVFYFNKLKVFFLKLFKKTRSNDQNKT